MSTTTVNLTQETDRVERAYLALRAALRTMEPTRLDSADLDLVIADLVSIRHGRMTAGRGYQQRATAATVVVERVGDAGVEATIASLKTRLDLTEFGRFAADAVDTALGLVTDSALREVL